VSRDWLLVLDDMIEAAEKVERLTAHRTFQRFVDDEGIFDAVLMNPLVIGEAAKNIPKEVLVTVPLVDWSGAAGLRDIIAHRYFGVDQELVWDIVRNYVPGLLGGARRLRDPLPPTDQSPAPK
jgi:uncharacterized protein with HEPN domain